MKKRDFELLVSRLNGYVRAMADLDGVFGDSIAAAYLVPFDVKIGVAPDALSGGELSDYVFGRIVEVEGGNRVLANSLEKFFLQLPLSGAVTPDDRCVSETRARMVLYILDIIALIVGLPSRGVYRADTTFAMEFTGSTYVFPLNGESLVLRLVSRCRGEQHGGRANGTGLAS